MTATLAFFDITKSSILTPAPTATNPFALRPIGVVRSQGAEFDALGKLTNELSVIASYAHIDEKVIADNGGLLGLTPMSVAPNSGSLFLAYEFSPGSFLHGWRAGGGVYAASNRWGDDQDTLYSARLRPPRRVRQLQSHIRPHALDGANQCAEHRQHEILSRHRLSFSTTPRDLGSLPAPRAR